MYSATLGGHTPRVTGMFAGYPFAIGRSLQNRSYMRVRVPRII